MSRRRHYQNVNTPVSEYTKPSRQGRKNKSSKNDSRGNTPHLSYLDDSFYQNNNPEFLSDRND